MENSIAGRTFFVAPNGNDSHAGDIQSPLATIQKVHELVRPGDTIYLRGGTYKPAKDQITKLTKSGTQDAPIRLFAYGDEKPIIDGSDWTRRSDSVGGKMLIWQTGDYWHIKGIEMTGSPRQAYWGDAVRGSVYEDLNLHDNDNTGLSLSGDGTEDNLVLGGDFYRNYDPFRKGQDADGIAIKGGSGKGNVIRGARTFHNSDDGIDLYGFSNNITIENTWAYGNGVDRWGVGESFEGKDGVGFRLSADVGPVAEKTDLIHVIRNNLAWENANRGFSYNGSKGSMKIYNNTSYNNGVAGFAFNKGTHQLRNNVAIGDQLQIGGDVDDANNSWTLNVTVDTSDFLSLDSSQAEGLRQVDGSLPTTDFLGLKAGSDLVDAGVDVGDPFEGAAPDLGAKELDGQMGSNPITPELEPAEPPNPLRPQPPQMVEPVAKYGFDNMITNTIVDDSTAGLDNSGTLINGIREEGTRGRHIILKGDGQVIIPNSTDINLGIQPERTVSLWFKVDDASINSRKQVLYEEGAGMRGLNAYIFDNKLFVGGWNEPTRESNWEGDWIETDQIIAGGWNHLAFVLDGGPNVATDALTGYLNGEVFGSTVGSQLWEHIGGVGLGSINGGTKFHDGRKPWSGNGLAGALDNVEIYNSALSAEQVQTLAGP